MRRRRILIGAGALTVALLAAFAFVYLVVLADDAPDRLQLGDAPTGATVPGGEARGAGGGEVGLAGAWEPGPGSIAGYRVREKLASLSARSDAVARTGAITGRMVLTGTDDDLTVTEVELLVDVSTLESDPPARRDSRMRTEGLQTDTYPTARFTLLDPIGLPEGAAEGTELAVDARGTLEIHGTPRAVTIPLQAQRRGDTIEVVGSLRFPMADFGIDTPNVAGFVSVDDDATLEFQVFFIRAAGVAASTMTSSTSTSVAAETTTTTAAPPTSTTAPPVETTTSTTVAATTTTTAARPTTTTEPEPEPEPEETTTTTEAPVDTTVPSDPVVVTLRITGRFFPAYSVPAGAQVIVVNEDAAEPHTLTATDRSFDSGVLGSGGSGSFRAPASPGSYPIVCDLHPEQTGALRVG